MPLQKERPPLAKGGPNNSSLLSSKDNLAPNLKTSQEKTFQAGGEWLFDIAITFYQLYRDYAPPEEIFQFVWENRALAITRILSGTRRRDVICELCDLVGLRCTMSPLPPLLAIARGREPRQRKAPRRGWPDFVLIPPTGQVHCLELKRHGGSLSDAQADFQLWCTRHGVPYVVAHSIDEVLVALDCWGCLRIKVGGRPL